jgi:phage shock protein C
MSKQLYRSETNKVISGVVGGIGEYLEIDPTILRVAWIAITVFTGIAPGIIIYILAILVIPPQRTHISSDSVDVTSDESA